MTLGTRQFIKADPDHGLPFSLAVKAGGLIYVSGTLPTDSTGRVAPGGIGVQTRQTLDNIAAVLDKAGSDLANAASVMVYLKNASDFPAMNEVYRTYWAKDPPARTTVMASLVLPEALIEIAVVAIPKGGERIVVHPQEWVASPNPYSYGIKTGNTLFLSGLVSRNGKDNSLVQGDTEAQTRTVLDNGGKILKAAGMGFDDVVSARIFLTEEASLSDVNRVFERAFSKAQPARAAVRAGLMGRSYWVEVTLVAVRDAVPKAVGRTASGTSPQTAAVRVGDRLYLAGMTAETTDGNVKEQTSAVLASIGAALKAEGFEFKHLVDAVVYLPDLSRFAEMNAAYREVFTKDFPARATVGVRPTEGHSVEIMMTAAK